MIRALRSHWPEYLIEAAPLALFMVSASAFTILPEYPHSPFFGVGVEEEALA